MYCLNCERDTEVFSITKHGVFNCYCKNCYNEEFVRRNGGLQQNRGHHFSLGRCHAGMLAFPKEDLPDVIGFVKDVLAELEMGCSNE